ncbi:type VI secretion system baseplate subunit TssE [Burkholderia ubonensis]|uniref:type VI secretion system baseplate subunit TssE n=1 Tax=Burkholderia ubonensis TaxID=101571 RepID=UPI000751D4E3|nr:type VI secretion system baseplate subunit TssE [Burkholderia ubonensis]KVO39586.1 cytoplasmic protein [Burkholderia ubonensis]
MRHSDDRHRAEYLPSLFDRLRDDAPHARSEPPGAYAANADDMRRIIQRDLSLLLNASNIGDELNATRYPHAAASVVNYGMPPLSGGYLGDRRWESIERLIRTAIVRFEPRLIADSIRIRPLNGRSEATYNKLMLEIDALVQWSPYPLEFRIQSTFDLEMNRVTLDSAMHHGN